MIFHKFESVKDTRATERHGTTLHVFNDAYERPHRPGDRVERPGHETEAPGAGADKRVPKVVDCSRQCPFKGIHSAQSQMQGDSDQFTKRDALALKNFDPNNGRMTESQITAIAHLKKHAMDAGSDGEPLWKSYAPDDPAARSQFKDMLFSGNADYQSARSLMSTSESQYSRDMNSQTVRDYGESFSKSEPPNTGPIDSISYNAASIYR